jgi:hypothetical protein
MNKMLLSMFTALVFFVAVAVAQSTPQSDTSGAQGTQSSSPAASQGSTGSSTSQGSTGGSMSQGSMGTENKGEAKGEKKLKGCIKSEGGQSVLEEKSGKTVNLTGSDVSAHNGHEVTVHGTWEGGAAATASSPSGAATAKAGKTFNVTSVDMISDSCTGGKTKGGASSTPPPTGQQ